MLDGREISLADAERSHRAVVVMLLSTICPGGGGRRPESGLSLAAREFPLGAKSGP